MADTSGARDAAGIDEQPRSQGDTPGQGRGRPSGVPEDGRAHAEGRPTLVREAQPETPPVETQPTEGAVDRGQTPATENDPGQDL